MINKKNTDYFICSIAFLPVAHYGPGQAIQGIAGNYHKRGHHELAHAGVFFNSAWMLKIEGYAYAAMIKTAVLFVVYIQEHWIGGCIR